MSKRMVTGLDGARVPAVLDRMACGGVPYFDVDSGCAYRCDTCGAVLGSIAQSPTCIEMNDDEENRKTEWKMLAGEL